MHFRIINFVQMNISYDINNKHQYPLFPELLRFVSQFFPFEYFFTLPRASSYTRATRSSFTIALLRYFIPSITNRD